MSDQFAEITTFGETLVARIVSQSLRTESCVEGMDRVLTKFRSSDQRVLVLDFADVTYLSSTALGRMVALNRDIKAMGRKMQVCNLSDMLAEILVITGLDRVLDIDNFARCG